MEVRQPLLGVALTIQNYFFNMKQSTFFKEQSELLTRRLIHVVITFTL